MTSITDTDWRPKGLDEQQCLTVALLAPDIGSELYEPGDMSEQELDQYIRDQEVELKDVTGAGRVIVRPIDPREGASGYGLGSVLQFLSVGADVITWGGGAVALAEGIRRGAKKLRDKQVAATANAARVLFSKEALQVLVVADVQTAEGVTAESIRRIDHMIIPGSRSEPRVELMEIYSAHVIALRVQEPERDAAWAYVVYSDGAVITKSYFALPQASINPWESFKHDLPYLTNVVAG